jgi:hypothetical protein
MEDRRNISAYEKMLENQSGSIRPVSLKNKYYLTSANNGKYITATNPN